MRILLLTHAFNSLTQRLWAELVQRGHELSIEFDIADAVAEEAVALYRPQLIVAPYLRRAIPASVWSRLPCLIVHPGPVGDRGPSALDHAIMQGVMEWGVTVLQAEAEMDAGPVWAEARFTMRAGRKASIYRHEVTEAAVTAVLAAIDRLASGDYVPQRPLRTNWQPLMTQSMRRIDWQRDDTATVLRKIDASDGFPGVADEMFGLPCRLFDAWPEANLRAPPGTAPGTVFARRETALLRATVDGALWIGHVKVEGGIKLPATLALGEAAAAVPLAPTLPGWWRQPAATWQDIGYEEAGDVGFLHFEFYNGAMSARQCERLRAALAWAKARPINLKTAVG